jgi:hypothetical protein
MNRVSHLDMICVAEFPRSELPSALDIEFCWRIHCEWEKSRPLTSDITRKECMALKSLKDNKKISILQKDKGNCTVVLNKSTYKRRYPVYYNQGFMKFYIRTPHLKLR